MHHANFEDGSGWCMYSDWVLAMRMLRRETGGRIQKAIIIDLDVHQARCPLVLLPHHLPSRTAK